MAADIIKERWGELKPTILENPSYNIDWDPEEHPVEIREDGSRNANCLLSYYVFVLRPVHGDDELRFPHPDDDDPDVIPLFEAKEVQIGHPLQVDEVYDLWRDLAAREAARHTIGMDLSAFALGWGVDTSYVYDLTPILPYGVEIRYRAIPREGREPAGNLDLDEIEAYLFPMGTIDRKKLYDMEPGDVFVTCDDWVRVECYRAN